MPASGQFLEGTLVEVDYPVPGALQVPRWRLGVVRRVCGGAVLVEGSHAGLLRLSASSPRLAPAFTHTVWCGDAALVARSAIAPGAALVRGPGYLRLGGVVMTPFRTLDGREALGAVELRETAVAGGRWGRALVRECSETRRRLHLQWCDSDAASRSSGGGGGGGGGSGCKRPRAERPELKAGSFWVDVDVVAKAGRLAYGRHYCSPAVARWGLAHPFLSTVKPALRPWVRHGGDGQWVRGDVVAWDEIHGCKGVGAGAVGGAALGGDMNALVAATAPSLQVRVRFRTATGRTAERWFSVLDPEEIAALQPPPSRRLTRSKAADRRRELAAAAATAAAGAAQPEAHNTAALLWAVLFALLVVAMSRDTPLVTWHEAAGFPAQFYAFIFEVAESTLGAFGG